MEQKGEEAKFTPIKQLQKKGVLIKVRVIRRPVEFRDTRGGDKILDIDLIDR